MIKLNEIIDGLEFVGFGLDKYAYLNLENDEIIYVDEYDDINDDYEFDDNFIMLPSKYEIDEYSMMEEFIETIDDVKLYNQLRISITGRGAFRRFKDTCINYEIIEDWYKFRNEKYKEIAIDWCIKNNIKYKE